METGRLNCYIPKPELEAFKAWCKERGLSQSRAITGLLHTFNAQQERKSAKELDRFTANLERASHVRYEAEKEKARRMVAEAGASGNVSSVEQSSADFLDLE